MGPTKVSKADFDKTLVKNSADTSAKQNAESIELLRQAAGKLEDASDDDIAAVLSNLSLADREKLEKVLRSNAVEAKPDEEPQPLAQPVELLKQAAVKVEDATVNEIEAALSNLSPADREKLENVLRSNAVKVIGSQFFADGDEETKPVDGPKSLEDARGDVEAQPPQGTDKVKDPCAGAICGCF